jgi:copper chaperone CopZ
VKTELYMPGANCPVCLNTIRSLLLDDPRVDSVHMSFPNRSLEVVVFDSDGLALLREVTRRRAAVIAMRDG